MNLTSSRKIIIGNWKMNKTFNQSLKLANMIANKFSDFKDNSKEVVICPNFTVLPSLKEILKKTSIKIGAQNISSEEKGSFTGEVDPKTLIENSCKYVIIGHSERREYMLESNSMINKKVKNTILTKKIVPIICIGEKAKEIPKRKSVLSKQIKEALANVKFAKNQIIIIAYEPIWAIGSGEAITVEEAATVHKMIKKVLVGMFGYELVDNNFRIIYGGSVNSINASELIAIENIDGLLIGGSSLVASEFYKICKKV